MRHLEAQGDLPEGTCSDWASKTDFSDLPEKKAYVAFSKEATFNNFSQVASQATRAANTVQRQHERHYDMMERGKEDPDEFVDPKTRRRLQQQRRKRAAAPMCPGEMGRFKSEIAFGKWDNPFDRFDGVDPVESAMRTRALRAQGRNLISATNRGEIDRFRNEVATGRHRSVANQGMDPMQAALLEQTKTKGRRRKMAGIMKLAMVDMRQMMELSNDPNTWRDAHMREDPQIQQSMSWLQNNFNPTFAGDGHNPAFWDGNKFNEQRTGDHFRDAITHWNTISPHLQGNYQWMGHEALMGGINKAQNERFSLTNPNPYARNARNIGNRLAGYVTPPNVETAGARPDNLPTLQNYLNQRFQNSNPPAGSPAQQGQAGGNVAANPGGGAGHPATPATQHNPSAAGGGGSSNFFGKALGTLGAVGTAMYGMYQAWNNPQQVRHHQPPPRPAATTGQPARTVNDNLGLARTGVSQNIAQKYRPMGYG